MVIEDKSLTTGVESIAVIENIQKLQRNTIEEKLITIVHLLIAFTNPSLVTVAIELFLLDQVTL